MRTFIIITGALCQVIPLIFIAFKTDWRYVWFEQLCTPIWVSIRLAKNCLFSRRNGIIGKKIFGLSICVKLFGFDIFFGGDGFD